MQANFFRVRSRAMFRALRSAKVHWEPVATTKVVCAQFFRFCDRGDTAYLLRMSRPVALALVSHLSKFKVFFKCSLQILEHSRVWGLWSNSDMPLATDNLVQADSTLVCHFSHAPDQVELWQPHPPFFPAMAGRQSINLV